MFTASTVAIVLMSGSGIIALLTLHLLWRAGTRQDPMCGLAMMATMLGLNMAARDAEVPGDLWYAAAFGLILFLFGLLAWLEGLRRLRRLG